MKNHFKISIIITLIATLLMACQGDMEKPLIVINEPSANAVIECGDTLTVDFSITDNEALNQFKIDIHGDHDGHSHGKLAWLFPAFDTIIIENLNGISADRHIRIPTPANAWPGPYHVIVYATDQSGNEQITSRNITLINYTDTVAPTAQITSPSDAATLTNPFLVTAQIQDLLSDGNAGEVRTIKVLLVQGASEFLLGTFDEPGNFNGAYSQVTGNFSYSFNMPSGVSAGNYELEIEVYDSYFNHAHTGVDVLVP